SILFQIYDVFLQNKLVAVDYNFSILSDGKTLYTKSGKSSDVADMWNEVRFFIPEDVSNIITVHFDKLGGNGFANAQIPIMVLEQGILVPSWIKQTAGWWCNKSITDDDFLRGIEYLIKNRVIQISEQAGRDKEKVVPDWVRSNSCWWAEGAITDGDFVNGLSYLVRHGIIVAS
ncbi:MAG: peptidase, partial [Candidatus Nitrosotenuis sp.]